jgi:hypothetical protein
MGIFDSLVEMAKGGGKEPKGSANAQRGKETAKTGKAPGKPASQTSPKGPQPKK